jgi:hypothetical protein
MDGEFRQAVVEAWQRAEVRAAVAAVYEEAGREIERRRPVCVASGRCCRFEEYGHRMYVSTAELAVFLGDLREDADKNVRGRQECLPHQEGDGEVGKECRKVVGQAHPTKLRCGQECPRQTRMSAPPMEASGFPADADKNVRGRQECPPHQEGDGEVGNGEVGKECRKVVGQAHPTKLRCGQECPRQTRMSAPPMEASGFPADADKNVRGRQECLPHQEGCLPHQEGCLPHQQGCLPHQQGCLPHQEGCPFQVGRLCGVHGIRPLGCRLFFCDVGCVPWQQELYERCHAELKRLHERLDIRYFYVEWRQGLREVMGLDSGR